MSMILRNTINNEIRPVNIWRARHIESGAVHYVVGSYDDKSGEYSRAMTSAERMYNPSATAVFGDFRYCAQYTSEKAARAAARSRYGWSKIADAYGGLGHLYERIS